MFRLILILFINLHHSVLAQTYLPSFIGTHKKKSDWSPSDETTLKVWWDASDVSTLSGDPIVTQITSKKGTFTLTSTGTPTRTTINSLTAIDFIRSSNERMNTSGLNFGITNGNMIIVGAVAIDGVSHVKDAIWSIRDDNGSNNDIHLRSGNDSQFDGAFETEGLGSSENNLSGGATRNFSGGPYSGNNIHATILDADNNDIYGYINGTERIEISNEYLTNVEMSNSVFYIHSNRSANRELDGKFMELMIFNSNDTNLAIKAEGYLAHKWGLTGLLPNGHLYKNSAP